MNLSRLILHPLSRDVASVVQDAHKLHAFVMRGFGDAAVASDGRATHGVLHRLDVDPKTGSLILYVLARSQPDWSRLPSGAIAPVEGAASTRPFDPVLRELAAGMPLRFSLRANVTKKVDTKSVDGVRRNGRRVSLQTDAERLAWLQRKGTQHGFDIALPAMDVSIAREGRAHGQRGGKELTFDTTRFSGTLVVRDVGAFGTGIAHGIGPAKAYGCGLLLIAPA